MLVMSPVSCWDALFHRRAFKLGVRAVSCWTVKLEDNERFLTDFFQRRTKLWRMLFLLFIYLPNIVSYCQPNYLPRHYYPHNRYLHHTSTTLVHTDRCDN